MWVGSGQNWIYVFDRKRTYGSFFAKTNSTKEKSAAKTKTSTKKKSANSGVDKTQPVDKKTAKKLASASPSGQIKAGVKTTGKAMAKAKKSAGLLRAIPSAGKTKTAKSGNWSKVNGRWVYVPDTAAGRGVPPVGAMANQVSKAPATGGWVQRNNRWVYVAPQNGNAGPQLRKGSERRALGNASKPASAKKPIVSQGEKGKVATIVKKPASGIVVVQKSTDQKNAAKPATAGKAKSGLAEGPDEVVGNKMPSGKRRVWRRKENRWVYANEQASGTSRSAKPAAQKRRSNGSHMSGMAMTRQGTASAAQKSRGAQTCCQDACERILFLCTRENPGDRSVVCGSSRAVE